MGTQKNRLISDESYEIPCLIFSEKFGKMLHYLLSAAVVIGALRVKSGLFVVEGTMPRHI